jgi:hypothetical protein
MADTDPPKAHWQIRLSDGGLIAGDYSWMDGGGDPDRPDWVAVEGYIEDGVPCEAWWMVPIRVVAAVLPAPDATDG